MVVRMRRSVHLIVDLFADEVDPEGNESDAETRCGVTQLIAEHRMLPPAVPPPEELRRILSCSASARCHLVLSLSLGFVVLLLYSYWAWPKTKKSRPGPNQPAYS